MHFITKNKINKYEKIFILLIIFFISFSAFFGIPSDGTNIGISSSDLSIGDRLFYIHPESNGYGYKEYSGNTLYPFFLRTITNFVEFFGKDQYSKLWNLIVISISSTLSILSLSFIRRSTLSIFNEQVSNEVSLIYILNPY